MMLCIIMQWDWRRIISQPDLFLVALHLVIGDGEHISPARALLPSMKIRDWSLDGVALNEQRVPLFLLPAHTG